LRPTCRASGNAVLQSTALGFRQAQITWLADGQDDVQTARGYYEDLSEQTYTDYADVDHTVRVIAFSAQLRVGDFWDCAATLLELP
jgi:hypothetical protein